MTNQEPLDANDMPSIDEYPVKVFISDALGTIKRGVVSEEGDMPKPRSPAASIWHKDDREEITKEGWGRKPERHMLAWEPGDDEPVITKRGSYPSEPGSLHTISALTYRNITTNWHLCIEPWNRTGGLRHAR